MSLPLRWDYVALPETPSAPPVREPSRKRQPLLWLRLLGVTALAMGLLFLLTLTVIGGITFAKSLAGPSALEFRTAPSPSHQVHVEATNASRQTDFVTVTGTIANNSSRSFASVEAIVELLDKQNRTLRVESALVPFVLSANSKSVPFQVVLPDDSHAVAYSVHFRQLMGPAL